MSGLLAVNSTLLVLLAAVLLPLTIGTLYRIARALERLSIEGQPAQWPTCDETLNGEPGDLPCTRPMGHGGGCTFP